MSNDVRTSLKTIGEIHEGLRSSLQGYDERTRELIELLGHASLQRSASHSSIAEVEKLLTSAREKIEETVRDVAFMAKLDAALNS